MQQNLFFPVYKQLEKELDELSYFITFDKKQLKTYSIKISELLLRTVSEIENISKELCKREKIKFYDKNKHIRKVVYFNDYFEKLEDLFLLSKKYVSFDLDNAEVEIINPVADTVATATFQGAAVDWYIKAEDIVLKKVTAINPQPPKKDHLTAK